MSTMNKFKDIYYRMLQTRFLEETLIEQHRNGKTFGPLHLCIGQEASGVASCAALGPEDVISTTHRGHAHYIGKGINLKRLCCEIWGKEEGYGKGRAGHMIVFDKEHGILGGSGIVGGSIPLAVGQALAFKIKNLNKVAVAFFGDGASNTGSFHESLNMAAQWKLPVVFFCETNQYGLTVHVQDHLSVKDVATRSSSYNMPGTSIFGNDMVEVYRTMSKVVEKARSGEGPFLVEAKTYRRHGFSTGDSGGYQREEEMKDWGKKDPIKLAEKWLISQNNWTKYKIGKARKKVLIDVKEAVEYALNAPYPEPLDLPGDLFEGA